MAGQPPQFIFPEPARTRARFRNPISKYRIAIDSHCDNCGVCIDACPYRVYAVGARRPRIVDEHFCLGPACEKNSFCCVGRCPRSAISL
ncbi:MAG: FMN-binding glutamate synthase family protein, partial [Deltaproteobacteria bacterium]